jgi:hypothetical protein
MSGETPKLRLSDAFSAAFRREMEEQIERAFSGDPTAPERPRFIRFGDVLVNLNHVVTVTLNIRGGVVFQTDVHAREGEEDPRLVTLSGEQAAAAIAYFTGDDFPDLTQGA